MTNNSFTLAHSDNAVLDSSKLKPATAVAAPADFTHILFLMNTVAAVKKVFKSR